jgi:hypothetical protein
MGYTPANFMANTRFFGTMDPPVDCDSMRRQIESGWNEKPKVGRASGGSKKSGQPGPAGGDGWTGEPLSFVKNF